MNAAEKSKNRLFQLRKEIVKAKTAALLLGLIAAIFECIWIIACVASLYFFAVGQWLNLAGALVAAVAANWLAGRFKGLMDSSNSGRTSGEEA